MVKNLPAMQETRFDPWVRKIPWRWEWLPPGRKVMTNLESILKSRDITLPTKVHLVETNTDSLTVPIN